MKILSPIKWYKNKKRKIENGKLIILDQTKLPSKTAWLNLKTINEVWYAIKTLQVRGAPAIGVTAAFGVVIAAQNAYKKTHKGFISSIENAITKLKTSRPTAVNLFWALDRMKKVLDQYKNLPKEEIIKKLIEEAENILHEDINMCRKIGEHGATLLEDGFTVLTHCNAGTLATSKYGTALSPIYVATEQGKKIKVFANETRPLLQGSRLTVWELMASNIDVTLICDNMAGQVMKEGKIDCVFVGADRIAANGDTANKIGTYSLAILAKYHNIPFYVFAPSSTFDLSINSGKSIPIEQRSKDEIIYGFGKMTAPKNTKVYSPAFDVTPASLITAIICEKGIINQPLQKNIKIFFK